MDNVFCFVRWKLLHIDLDVYFSIQSSFIPDGKLCEPRASFYLFTSRATYDWESKKLMSRVPYANLQSARFLSACSAATPAGLYQITLVLKCYITFSRLKKLTKTK